MTSAPDTRTVGRTTRHTFFSPQYFFSSARTVRSRSTTAACTYLPTVPTYTIYLDYHTIPLYAACTPLLSRRRVAVACSACRPPLTFSSYASAVIPRFVCENLFITFGVAVSGCVPCPPLVSFPRTINVTTADENILTDKPLCGLSSSFELLRLQ